MDNLLLGLQTALQINNLLYALAGVVVGNLVGVLPGIGALAGISLLLPVTYSMDPTGAILMLSGIYYGTKFGGATTAILLNIPGTAPHAVLCLDGHPLALQGRAGPAIFIAMFAGFIGVGFSIILMALFSPVLSEMALRFGPAEYFSLMLMGVLASSAAATNSPVKGVASVVLGLLAGVIGTDMYSGIERFTFGLHSLADGLSLVALALALFGLTDIYANAGNLAGKGVDFGKVKGDAVRPGRGELRQSVGPIGRGCVLGAFLGVLPGAGGPMASFLSYVVEKKTSKTPERFGKGAIEGVAGPEAANSSAGIAAFIPTLTLGIPGDAVMALMLGALMIQNILPGPQLITDHPSLFWGLIVSFGVGNILLLALNIPLIGVWVKMLSVPYRYIYPVIIFLIGVGAYSVNNEMFDIASVLILGVLGYLAKYLGFQPAPLLLGFVLGPMMEENFRRSLLLSRGDLTVFFTRPLSGIFMWIIVLGIVYTIGAWFLRYRRSGDKMRQGG